MLCEGDAMASSLLLQLPDELLLHIFNYTGVLPRCRRRDLMALMLVCKRLNTIVTMELLHSELCISIYSLTKLLQLYVEKPTLSKKVKSLELLYERSGKDRRAQSKQQPDFVFSTRARDAYLDAMRKDGLSDDNQQQLLLRLASRDSRAVITVALLMMPNIVALRLCMATPDTVPISDMLALRQTSSDERYFGDSQRYLDETITQLAKKITTLEMPSMWLGPSADLRMFSNLRALTMDVRGLASALWHPRRRSRVDHAVLPVSLRRLTIGHASVENLLALEIMQAVVKRKVTGVSDNLETLEMYVDGRNPSEDNTLFYTTPTPEEEKDLAEQLARHVQQLKDLGVTTIFHWCHWDSIFGPMTRLVSSSLYSDDDLRTVEITGALEHLRPEAEAMGKRTRKLELERKERRHAARRKKGEHSETGENSETSDQDVG
jgi:hypothetical protein